MSWWKSLAKWAAKQALAWGINPYLETRDGICKAFRPKNAIRPARSTP